jgi:hypothetical protein
MATMYLLFSMYRMKMLAKDVNYPNNCLLPTAVVSGSVIAASLDVNTGFSSFTFVILIVSVAVPVSPLESTALNINNNSIHVTMTF